MTPPADDLPPGFARENVWDYPRPPALEPVGHTLRVVADDIEIARTGRGHRVLETSHPPTYYFPAEDVRMDLMEEAPGTSFCEFKGRARYWSIRLSDRTIQAAAWSYPTPNRAFLAIQGHLCFYASKVDACYVGPLRARAQDGDFYGGWITANLEGPFKGGPGTRGW